ncbi:MAG: PspC domain-containing protein [Mucilaginibacter sp.]|uniref:PspC domain-containing protein n=1 Tax=Mucilaginibacter sp. TaxID=1882438 RepID=UPI003266939D
MSSNRLYRDEQYKKIGGVCAGLAEYFNVDVSLVRVLFVLAAVLGGGGVLGYFILWIVVPAKPMVSPSDDFFNSSQSQPQYQAQPITGVKRKDHTGRYIGGLILIFLGVYIMLEQYDLIPEIRLRVVAPVVLIIIGLVLMFGFWVKHPADKQATDFSNNDSSSTDNSQTL